jgi:putative Holliday junction resolvase
MKFKLVQECRADIPQNCRLMGLDLGAKTIGVAISNTKQTIATPVTTVKRTKFSRDMMALYEVITEFEIGGYILGWPLHMDGSLSPRCDAVSSFADEMTRNPDIFGVSPFIALQDERLSTSAVDNFVHNRVDINRTKKRGAKEAGLTDQLAAQLILQSALA